MPTTVTEVDAFTAIVEVPNNGEVADQSAWLEVAQPLANRTHFLRERIKGLSATTLVCPVNLARGYGTGAGTPWALQPNPGYASTWLETAISSTVPLTFEITDLLPISATIVGFGVYVEGGTGHAGLPGTMPTVKLLSSAYTLGDATFTPAVLTVEGSQVDISGSVAAYEVVHSISVGAAIATSVGYGGAGSKRYYLALYGESGANSLVSQLTLGDAYFLVSL